MGPNPSQGPRSQHGEKALSGVVLPPYLALPARSAVAAPPWGPQRDLLGLEMNPRGSIKKQMEQGFQQQVSLSGALTDASPGPGAVSMLAMLL